MRLIFYFNLLLTLTLNACNLDKESPVQQGADKIQANDTKSVSNLVIDLKSPDNAVKSMWAVLDEKRRLDVIACEETANTLGKYYEPVMINIKKVSNKLISDSYKKLAINCANDTYSKEIIEVKNESETRAIVFAKLKNITPIPAGAKPDADDIKRREDGEDFKYVLEKDSEGWKVVQVYNVNIYVIDGEDKWSAEYKDDSSPSIPYFIFYH